MKMTLKKLCFFLCESVITIQTEHPHLHFLSLVPIMFSLIKSLKKFFPAQYFHRSSSMLALWQTTSQL